MNRSTKKISLVLGFLLTILIVNADDTDIINNATPTDSNILFVMDMSGSMDWELSSDNPPLDPKDSRKNILHAALRTVLNDPLLTDVNIGISSFSGNLSVWPFEQKANGISYPVSPIDADAATILDQNPLFNHQGISYLPVAGGVTSRGYIGDKIPSIWTPYGVTPLVDALFEASLYFRGESVYWGKKLPSDGNSAHPSSYTGLVEEKAVVNCPVGDPIRESCDSEVVGGCNATKSCSGTSLSTKQCVGIDAISPSACITDLQTNGYTCASPVDSFIDCAEGVSVCGAATNVSECTSNLTPVNRYCPLATIAACESQPAPKDTWYSCKEYGDKESGYDIWCKEDVGIYTCPQKTTTCTKDVPICTHCPPTVVTGAPIYDSPIKKDCSNNAIVLLSDGSPTNNDSATLISNMIGATYANSCSSGFDGDRCGRELAKFLANEDQNPSLAGIQSVKTHTIGLALRDASAIKFLQDLASNGGGKSVMADSATSLVKALHDTVTYIPKARTFSSPTYTISASSLSHGEYVYLPVFDKGVGAVWSGNLKKYKRNNGKLYDVDNKEATDALGSLFDTAKDYWATVASKDAVLSGGSANKIPLVRELLTDSGSSGNLVDIATVSNADLDAADSTEKDKLVKFIKGKNIDGTPRNHMGDILHSSPVIVNYGSEKLIFVGTNEGLLHAINDATGEEKFAYMPRELLKNIKPQFENNASRHLYGVDGEITLWHNDTDHDQIVDTGETAILFFGLRRGGKAYYALDISLPASPKLKWKITNNTSSNFSQLGYTWSKPVVTQIGSQDILVFSGGYVDDNGLEPAHAGTPEADGSGTGSDVYLVNADTGAFIWKTPDSTIKYAVPGGVRVLDINRDGSADRLYFADTGGYVWRVDIQSKDISSSSFSSKVVVLKFADLGSVSSPATSRRKFFVEPDVALFRYGGKFFISVALGSGERPKPLDTTSDDYFFVLFDDKPFITPSSGPNITIGELLTAPVSPPTNVFTSSKKGWFMDLGVLNGEKVLSNALTYNNRVIFSTFGTTSLSTASTTTCKVSNTNQARLYVLDILSGSAVLDLDGDSTVGGVGDFSKELASGEIPGAPQIIYSELQSDSGGSCVKDNCIRPEEIAVGKSPATSIPGPYKTLRKAFWLDKDQ